MSDRQYIPPKWKTMFKRCRHKATIQINSERIPGNKRRITKRCVECGETFVVTIQR